MKSVTCQEMNSKIIALIRANIELEGKIISEWQLNADTIAEVDAPSITDEELGRADLLRTIIDKNPCLASKCGNELGKLVDAQKCLKEARKDFRNQNYKA